MSLLQKRTRRCASSRLHRAILETLEQRVLLTALYWDTSASAGLQSGNGT